MRDGEVVVLAAMPRELRPLVRALRLQHSPVSGLPAWRGPWRGQGIVAASVGVGPERATAGSSKVLDAVRAQRVLVTGVAGALDAALCVGAVVRPTHVIDVAGARTYTPHGVASRSGVLATVGEIAFPEAGVNPEPGEPTAVDMETAAIAAVCEARGVPWDVVRAISDVPGTLTPDMASLLRPDGRVDVVAAARLVLRHPGALGALLRLGVDTSRAVRRATAVVVSELDGGDPGTPGAQVRSERKGKEAP